MKMMKVLILGNRHCRNYPIFPGNIIWIYLVDLKYRMNKISANPYSFGFRCSVPKGTLVSKCSPVLIYYDISTPSTLVLVYKYSWDYLCPMKYVLLFAYKYSPFGVQIFRWSRVVFIYQYRKSANAHHRSRLNWQLIVHYIFLLALERNTLVPPALFVARVKLNARNRGKPNRVTWKRSHPIRRRTHHPSNKNRRENE